MKIKYFKDIETIYEDVNPKYIPNPTDEIYINGKVCKQHYRIYHPNVNMLIIYLE